MFNKQFFTFFFTVTACIGLSFFTSCNNEDDISSLEEMIECDSFTVFIGFTADSVNLTATVSEGTAPFTYDWSSGETTQEIEFTGETASVTVTDANGCEAEANYEITENAPCENFDVQVYSTQDSTGGTGLTVYAVVQSGTGPFDFIWSNGNTDSNIENAGPGIYSVTVTDANGCVTEDDNEVVDCSDVSVSITATENGSEATLTAEITGGTPPFSYFWSDSTNVQTTTVTEYGTYIVNIFDDNGCSATAAYNFNSGDPCFNFFTEIDVAPDSLSNNGFILNAYPSGGTPPFDYIWSQGATDAILYEVQAGTYAVTVSDAEGCETEDEVTIE